MGGWLDGTEDELVVEGGGEVGELLVGEEEGLDTILARCVSAFVKKFRTASIAAEVGALSTDAKSKLFKRLTRVVILLIIDTLKYY